jgi:hypothetical protein
VVWWTVGGVVLLAALLVGVARAARVALGVVERRAGAAVEAELGGHAEVVVRDRPVVALLGLRRGRVPAGRLVLLGGRLPNGLRVERAELRVDGGAAPGRLVADVLPQDVGELLAVQGLRVEADGARLRLRLGPARLAVEVAAHEGRVALRVPAVLPPFRGLVSSGLTDLVPPPPPGLELQHVAVTAGRLRVRAMLAPDLLARLAAPTDP